MVSTLPTNSVVRDDDVVNVRNESELPLNEQKPSAMSLSALSRPEKSALSGSAWNQGNCEHCKTDFKKKTTWQRFCNKDCKNAAYELRTGKKWHSKKTAAESG